MNSTGCLIGIVLKVKATIEGDRTNTMGVLSESQYTGVGRWDQRPYRVSSSIPCTSSSSSPTSSLSPHHIHPAANYEQHGEAQSGSLKRRVTSEETGIKVKRKIRVLFMWKHLGHIMTTILRGIFLLVLIFWRVNQHQSVIGEGLV